MMCHCFLLDGKKQAVDFDYLSPVIKMSVCIFVQIISTEMLVQKKLEYISGCYHVLRLQSRKNQGKKTEFFKTPVKQVKQYIFEEEAVEIGGINPTSCLV